MTEAQKREHYPQDYVEKEVAAVAPVTYGDMSAVPSANEFEVADEDELANFDVDAVISSHAANAEFDDELANFDMDAVISSHTTFAIESNTSPLPKAAKPPIPLEKQKTAVQQQQANESGNMCRSGTVVMVGLDSAHARVGPGEKVILIRDADDVSCNMLQLLTHVSRQEWERDPHSDNISPSRQPFILVRSRNVVPMSSRSSIATSNKLGSFEERQPVLYQKN